MAGPGSRRTSCRRWLLRAAGATFLSPMCPVFACDMMAIPADERGVHHALTRWLMSEAVAEIRELADGFAFRFPAGEYDSVAQFVARERLCCPFLRFELDVAPDGGPVWLRLTGPAGAAAFIRAELHVPAN